MANVLPQQAGLAVNGVLYQYTAVKNPLDDMIVHVQNENAQGSGYIFRESDDWSGLAGNTINKFVAVDNVPIGLWGDGSIEVEGFGTVSDPTVIYTYRVDECFNPQSSPACSGYQVPIDVPEPVNYKIYDATDDDAVRRSLEETNPDLYDRDGKKRRTSEDLQEDRLERALAASEGALALAAGISQEAMLQAMNSSVNLAAYYGAVITGGVYRETVKMPDTDIPDNEKGLRNGLAQQLLHEKMVKSQYGL
jgi:hypothetical protein